MTITMQKLEYCTFCGRKLRPQKYDKTIWGYCPKRRQFWGFRWDTRHTASFWTDIPLDNYDGLTGKRLDV